MDFSRRGFIGFLASLSGGVIAGGKIPAASAVAAPATLPVAPVTPIPVWLVPPGARLHEALRARLGSDIYMSWLQRIELEGFDGETVTVSLPVKFLRNWIESHWRAELLECCQAAFAGAQQVNLILRQPGSSSMRERLRSQ